MLSLMCMVPADRAPQPVQKLSAFTCDLHQLADWLATYRVTTVGMEFTGVTGFPCFTSLRPEALRSPLFMRATPKMSLGVRKPIASIVDGSKSCIRMDYEHHRFALLRTSAGSAVFCAIGKICSR